MVRLPEEEIAKVKKQGGRDFEPMPGHKMGGYVVVPGDWRTKPPTALIKDPQKIDTKILAIPGVLGTGIFTGMAHVLLLGDDNFEMVDEHLRKGL